MVTVKGGFAILVVLGYGLGPEFADPSTEELVPSNVDALVSVGWGMWVSWNTRVKAVDLPGESMDPCIKEDGRGHACKGEGIFKYLKGEIAVFSCIMGWTG